MIKLNDEKYVLISLQHLPMLVCYTAEIMDFSSSLKYCIDIYMVLPE